jgi:sterol desaturase/sphingolipid hydroxylase (fatty acid hydroxylase superfamily)
LDSISRTRFALTLLTILFLARVAGQATAHFVEPPMLPPDALWHTATMPYPVLAGIQVAMLAAMAAVTWNLGQVGRHPRTAGVFLAVGAAYLGAMCLRFVLGAAGVGPGGWLDEPISTPFHIVLAAWFLILAFEMSNDALRARIRSAARSVTRPLAYPAIIGAGCVLFLWLRRHGVPVQFSAYLPVILGASAILILELAAPYRRTWMPARRVVTQDALYLLVVQVALPAALTLAVAAAAAGAIGGGLGSAIWPHDWPSAAQALLMIATADFLRYWLHRAAHRWPVLWRLHAVHHAPEELYFLNVGRFHPLEKSIQFLFDAAPFILIGVGPEVIAAYFVFYSLNGFFQHSNVDVRLGPLNWLISGPELHRWHHSRIVRESEHNFGNNLIIWDAIFGTRFLPERQVGELGLQNRSYPKDFVGQTLAPVTDDPNRDPAGPAAP